MSLRERRTPAAIFGGPRPRSVLALLSLSVFLVAIGGAIATFTRVGASPKVPVIVIAGILLVIAGLVLSRDMLVLATIASVIFQGFLVIDVGVFVLPGYALTVLAMLRMLTDDRAPIRSPLRPAVVILVGLAIISVPVAVVLGGRFEAPGLGFRYSSVRPLIQLAALLLMIMSYVVVFKGLRTTEQYDRALRLFIWLGTVVALYALYQQVAFYLHLPGVVLPGSLRSAASFQFGSAVAYRSNATFFEPLDLGAFLIGPLSVTLAVIIGRPPGRRSPFLLFSLCAQLAALTATFSGGTYAGFLISCGALVLFAKRRGRSLGWVSLVALLALGVGAVGSIVLSGGTGLTPAEVLTERLAATIAVERAPELPSNAFVGFRRVDYWRAAVVLASRYPLTGVGIGNFGGAAVTVDPRLLPNAGSYGAVWGWLGEFGFPGLLAFLYLLAVFVVNLYRGYARYGRERPELLGFLAGFIGIAAQYGSHGYIRMDLHFWVFIGLAMVALRLSKEEAARVGRASRTC